MSFASRAFTGTVLTLTTASLLGVAGWRLHDSMATSEKRKRPPTRERSYTVDVDVLTAQTIAPVITAYGQVQTWNSLEIRAPASGPITELSQNFRDGLMVRKGELLFCIDPESAERRVIDAKAAVAQAQFELSEAKLALTHGEADLAATVAQVAIRRNDLKRKQGLAS